MKLNSIEANAHYDMAHGKPAVLEKDNDGSFLYRFNIEPETGIPEGKEKKFKSVGSVMKCAHSTSRQRRT